MIDRFSPRTSKAVSYGLIIGGAVLAGLMTTLSTVFESNAPALVVLVTAGVLLAVAFAFSIGNSGRVRRLEERIRELTKLDSEHAVGLVSVNDGSPRIGAIAVQGRVLTVLQEGVNRAIEFDLQRANVEELAGTTVGESGGFKIEIDGGASVEYSPLRTLWNSQRIGPYADRIRSRVELAISGY